MATINENDKSNNNVCGRKCNQYVCMKICENNVITITIYVYRKKWTINNERKKMK
jgi:hypothetical protein